MIRWTSLLAGVALVVSTVGCGAGSAPVAVTTGTVMYKDAPVKGANITMVSADGAINATGVTDENGKFEMGTFYNGENFKGAPLGPVKVAIVKMKDTGYVAPTPSADGTTVDPGAAMAEYMKKMGGGPNGGAAAPESEIPVRYNNPDVSGLNYTIDADPTKNNFDIVLTDQ